MIGNIDIRAVVLATLAVFGIDFITGIVLFSIFSSDQITNASDEQVRAAAVALARDPGYLRAALILGTASTVVGGFLVARSRAAFRTSTRLHTAGSAWCSARSRQVSCRPGSESSESA